MKALELGPLVRAAGTVRLPGSKSISNRVLLLAALCEAPTEVGGLLDADDTRVMRAALEKLGRPIRPTTAELFLGNAGTAFRPLTAVLAVLGGEYRLSGVPRMHERPIGDLVDALRALGARIDYLGAEGFPPLAIHAGQVAAGQTVRVRGDVSSQYLSALLMALPLAGGGTIEVAGELISKPYVEITLNLMRRFGVDVAREGWARFRVPGAAYRSPGKIWWRAMPRTPRTSLPRARWAAARCGWKAWDAAASRGMFASARCWRPWARGSRWARTGSRRAGARRCAPSTWISTTFRTRR